MSSVGFSFAHLLVLLGFIGPVGVPPLPDTPVISSIAPEKCLFYMSSAGRAEPSASSANQTEQLLAEPEVKKFAAQIETILKTALDRGLKEPGAPPLSSEEITFLVKTVFDRPLAVYVTDVQVQSDAPKIRGGAIVQLGDRKNQTKAILDKLVKLLPPGAVASLQDGGDAWQTFKPDPQVTLSWGFKNDCFLVAVGEGEIQSLAKRLTGKTPSWLAEIKKNAGIERVATVSYVNVKSILDIATPHGPKDAAQVFEAIGLRNIRNVNLVSGLDKVGFVSKTAINFEGTPSGLFAFANVKPLAAADLESIPADAVMALAFRADAVAIYDAYFKMIEEANPKAKEDMANSLSFAEQFFGLTLRDDILAALGDRVCLFNPGVGYSGLSTTLVVSLQNSQKAKDANRKLCETFQKAKNPQSPSINETEIEGQTIFSLEIPNNPVVMPTWCLTDRELIVSLTPDGVKSHLARGTDFESLATVPEAAKALQEGVGPLAFVYVDSKRLFQSMYPSLPVMLQMFAANLRSMGIDFNATMLPSTNTIGKHLFPATGSVKKTATGIEITERSPLPMSMAMSPLNPMSVSLLLPAVQAAREAARRANSSNSLKQIGLGMHNYADARRMFPPAYKADKDGKPLLSWRVLILPHLEEDELYNQFHLDEPWDSDHNKTLIEKMPKVYKSPNSVKSGEGKTNYLTVRGEKSVFNGNKGMKLADISDGTSYTIMTVEVNDDKAVIWTKPDDFEYDETNPLLGLGGLRANGFLAGFADGSVRFIANSIDAEILKALFIRNDNKPASGEIPE